MAVFSRVRDLGPTVLIPLAWAFTGLSIGGVVARRNMFVAHLVMLAFLLFFLATGWNRMTRGALRTWRTVMMSGTLVTALGLFGFLRDGNPLLLGTSLVGWMVLPAAGLFDTATRVSEHGRYYAVCGGLSLTGAVLMTYFAVFDSLPVVVGVALLLVATGQSISILLASFQDRSASN